MLKNRRYLGFKKYLTSPFGLFFSAMQAANIELTASAAQ